MSEQAIHELLLSLGIGTRFAGYSVATEVILMVLADEKVLQCLKRRAMVHIAERTGRDIESLYQNLRTVSTRAWQTAPERLCKIAGYPLQKAPGVSEFIDILTTYLVRRQRWQETQQQKQNPPAGS